MKTNPMSRRKKWLIAGEIVFLILTILAGAFFWYVSDYYRADEIALDTSTLDRLGIPADYRRWGG